MLCINSTSVEKKIVVFKHLALSIVLNDCDGIVHHMEGHNAPTIARLLLEEGVKVSCVGILKFLAKYEETGSIGWRIGYGRTSKIMAEMKKLVEDQMHSDIETCTSFIR